MALSEKELDRIFCTMSRKYKLKKLILKAVGIIESSLSEKAYRFEPAFFKRYLKNHAYWKDKDPSKVSASWGIMQLMFVTAWEMLGFRGEAEDLENPEINIELGAKLLRKLLDRVYDKGLHKKYPKLLPLEIIFAQYNGGIGGNPNKEGRLRNQKYADKVIDKWREINKKEEEECSETN